METTITQPTVKKTLKHRQYIDTRTPSINEETRTVTVVASTEAIDSYGTIIKQDGWDLKRFIENPVVPLSHRWDDLPVGRVTRIEIIDKTLVADIQFAQDEMAERVWQLWRAGFLKAVSVGFMPIEWHFGHQGDSEVLIYDRCELLEISVVTIPANPEALAKTIVRNVRSTKTENKLAAESMIELMARLAQKPWEDDDKDEDDEPTADDLADIEDNDDEDDDEDEVLRAYRKLIPSLRLAFSVEKMENEVEQIKAIKDAIARRDDESDEQPPSQDSQDTAEPVPETPPTDEPVADVNDEVDDKQDDIKEADEPVLDDDDLAAIAEAAVNEIEANKSL